MSLLDNFYHTIICVFFSLSFISSYLIDKSFTLMCFICFLRYIMRQELFHFFTFQSSSHRSIFRYRKTVNHEFSMDFSRNISLLRTCHCYSSTFTIYSTNYVSIEKKTKITTVFFRFIVGKNFLNQDLQKHLQLERNITLIL